MPPSRVLVLTPPPIAQLIEQRNVDILLAGILKSLVQIRLGGQGFNKNMNLYHIKENLVRSEIRTHAHIRRPE